MRPSKEEMSGETKSAPRLELNELAFNGQKGQFFLVEKTKGLIQNGDKKGFNKIPLGETAKVVFLRIRRKLRQYRKNEKALTTNEHNTKFDMLTLFGDDRIVKGTNEELREKYQGLKTMQIVYALLVTESGNELVRLNVKGSSLGSQSKAKGVHDFYSYISSFKKDGADNHFYDFETVLSPVEEQSDAGTYYAMTFNVGSELNDEMKKTVEDEMYKVYEFVKKSDEYYNTKPVEEIQKVEDKAKEEGLPTIEYPDGDDEGINPDDIPF